MTVVEVHLFAAARAAAGAPVLTASPGSLGAVLDEMVRVAPDLAAVLPRCSFLVDGVSIAASALDTALPAGSRLDVLPPFAGG